jgi:hypothetical protein
MTNLAKVNVRLSKDSEVFLTELAHKLIDHQSRILYLLVAIYLRRSLRSCRKYIPSLPLRHLLYCEGDKNMTDNLMVAVALVSKYFWVSTHQE